MRGIESFDAKSAGCKGRYCALACKEREAEVWPEAMNEPSGPRAPLFQGPAKGTDV